MKKNLLFVLIGIYSNTCLHAQTTSPVPYCAAGFEYIGGDTTGSDWINSVQLGTLNNISNGVCLAPHYIFYNNLPVPDLTKNNSYPLTLNFYVGGGAGYAAWIDYNHNNIFDSTELVAGRTAMEGMAIGTPTITTTITIPATALSGNTRMRIRISENDTYHSEHPGAYELACDPVDTAYGGETEDYTVNILPALGVNTINNNIQFSLSPNPANNFLKIDHDLTTPLTYIIYSVTGNKILEGIVSKTKNSIDISTLNSGLYFIEIAGQQAMGYKKFIKL